jgi:hypothetical protein
MGWGTWPPGKSGDRDLVASKTCTNGYPSLEKSRYSGDFRKLLLNNKNHKKPFLILRTYRRAKGRSTGQSPGPVADLPHPHE